MPTTIRTYATVAVSLLLIRPAAGQRGSPASNSDVDAYVDAQMAAQHIPALGFAIIRNGEVVRSGTRGLASVELSAPATDDTEFAIASMSKSVTASAVMLLAQEGRLSIDDSVRKYLPEAPDTWSAMTIRHLLSHTAGVKDHFSDSPIYPKLPLDRHLPLAEPEYVKAHLEGGLNFPPGTSFSYSGGGYVILGAIIARITGAPYGDYLRDRVFRPLGMQHTHVISNAAIIPHRAAGYWFRDGALRNGDFMEQAHIGGPDTGVMTTAGDFARWMIAVSSAQSWTAASRDAMWTAMTFSDGRDIASFPGGVSYGLGWLVGTYHGYRNVGHGGTLSTGYTSAFVVLPEKQTAVVVLTNQYDANPMAIGYGLLGLSDPELRPAFDRRSEHDADPAATERDATFLAALIRGGDVSPWATPGLVRHLSTMWHPPDAAAAPAPSIAFIAREPVSRPVERFGATVAAFSYYKIHLDDEDHWLTVLSTRDGRVAGYEAF